MIDYSDRFEGSCVLSFDDGPNENTMKVLDGLKKEEVRGAAFCVQGVNAKKYPWILRRIVDEGHTLVNHSYDHPRLAELGGRQIVQQLRMCQEAVNDALGKRYRLTQMRPPFGSLDRRVLAILHALDIEVLLWQVDPKDFLPENQRNPGSIVHTVFQRTVESGCGGLILLHDIHETTADIVSPIIRLLASSGMEFTTAKELLNRKYRKKPHTQSLATHTRVRVLPDYQRSL
jgi:peptidoglycan/xylan/chitin deacetylase (PgdA/CDA1 family)